MELIPGVHLVGSGRLGFSLTSPYDCHVYLLVADGDAVLVDAGSGLEPDAIVARIVEAAVQPRSVSRILLTHAHADHAAGAARLAALLGAEIWAPAASAGALEAGDEDAVGLTTARRAGVYPEACRLAATPVNRALAEDELSVGSLRLAVVPTPGHSADHLAYAATIAGRRVLFAGDLVFARGRVALLGSPDCSLQAYPDSLDSARALAPDILFPGHGEPVLTGAVKHIDEARRCFADGMLPAALA